MHSNGPPSRCAWWCRSPPAKTPPAIVSRMQKDIAAVLQLPEIRSDLARWEAVVKKAGVRVE